MKFCSILCSHHDLKKNGYKIIKKLHKLERRTNLDRAYSKSCQDGFFVVLACKNLAELLELQYGKYENVYIQSFLQRTNQFVAYLEFTANNHARVNAQYLSAYLSAYTTFFHQIRNDRILFDSNPQIIEKWNVGCIMAYNVVWGS